MSFWKDETTKGRRTEAARGGAAEAGSGADGSLREGDKASTVPAEDAEDPGPRRRGIPGEDLDPAPQGGTEGEEEEEKEEEVKEWTTRDGQGRKAAQEETPSQPQGAPKSSVGGQRRWGMSKGIIWYCNGKIFKSSVIFQESKFTTI